jgi:hypothetical protein
MNLSQTGIIDSDMKALAAIFCQFTGLEHLDISMNDFKLISVDLLQVAARLQSFNCLDCPLVLPPNSFFAPEPVKNPRCAQELLAGRVSVTELDLSGSGFTITEAHDVASVIELYTGLKHLNFSTNPWFKLLPLALLRVVSTLQTFNCEGCSMLLPPQRLLEFPQTNPAVARGIMNGQLNMSLCNLTPSYSIKVASFLKQFSFLSQLDLSGNLKLGVSGTAAILKSLSGTVCAYLNRSFLIGLKQVIKALYYQVSCYRERV